MARHYVLMTFRNTAKDAHETSIGQIAINSLMILLSNWLAIKVIGNDTVQSSLGYLVTNLGRDFVVKNSNPINFDSWVYGYWRITPQFKQKGQVLNKLCTDIKSGKYG
jgi:formylmethanofuran dehydrogenase subunit A